MEPIQDNMQKYNNYAEQMRRLKKAIASGFYLEAIFIEYALLEDRLESILRHSGKWKPDPNRYTSITAKCSKVAKMAEQKKTLANRYFPKEMTDSVLAWVDKRNKLIHALLKQSLHTEDLQAVSQQGESLVKLFCSKSTSFNRALEKSKG